MLRRFMRASEYPMTTGRFEPGWKGAAKFEPAGIPRLMFSFASHFYGYIRRSGTGWDGREGGGGYAESDCVGSFRCRDRSEEHTSELQSRLNLVCRLLLEKKN